MKNDTIEYWRSEAEYWQESANTWALSAADWRQRYFQTVLKLEEWKQEYEH